MDTVTWIYVAFFLIVLGFFGLKWLAATAAAKGLETEAEKLALSGDLAAAVSKYRELVEISVGTEAGARGFARIVDLLRGQGCDVSGLPETYRDFAEWANAVMKGKPATVGGTLKGFLLPMASTGDSVRHIAQAQQQVKEAFPELWKRLPGPRA